MPNQHPPSRPRPQARPEQILYQARLTCKLPMQRVYTSKISGNTRDKHELNVMNAIQEETEDAFWDSIQEAYLSDEDRDAVLEGAVIRLIGWGDEEMLMKLGQWLEWGSLESMARVRAKGLKDFGGETGEKLRELLGPNLDMSASVVVHEAVVVERRAEEAGQGGQDGAEVVTTDASETSRTGW